MATTPNTFIVPDRTNSDFSGGHVCWSLFQNMTTWIRQSRNLDVLDFSDVVHLKPYAVALVVALAKQLGSINLSVIVPQDNEARNHLIRLGVPGAFGIDWGESELRSSNVPLEIVTKLPPAGFSHRTASLLAEEFPGGLAANVTARIADSIDEVILNAMAHSGSTIGCIVVGQAFPAKQCIEVAIVDLGITVRGHLGQTHPHLTTDQQAIQEAVKEGVTGTPLGQVNRLGDPNSGVGLSELKGFVEAIDGELSILSGSALVCFGPNSGTQPLRGEGFPGTLINVRFNTSLGSARPGQIGTIYY